MKNKLIIIFAFVLVLVACENEENFFPDYGSTSVYFPFQTPIRTLIQGKYDLGFNDNDNKGRFEIGLTMSGVYENKTARKVGFELAPEIIDAAALGVDTVNVKLLPASYYTIEQESPLTIPAGSIKGRIPVQLDDAFFDDPLAFAGDNEVHYVIPLKITTIQELDSLLTGVSVIDNPIRIRDEDWSTQPKDYTLYGIKFMNKYQGIYLRRGEDKVVGTSQTVVTKNDTGAIIESGDIENINGSTVYRAANVVQDKTTKVTTSGKNKGIYTNSVNRPGIASNTVLSLELVFNDNEEITITNSDVNSPFIVTGTGRFLEDGDEWGGENRDVIYLEYEYQDKEVNVSTRAFGRETVTSTLDLMHTVKDTLVIRNRDVKFEEFIVDLEKK